MATLYICHCGKHGHFVRRDGNAGPEFGFKKHGLYILRTGVRDTDLTEEEGRILKKELLDSSLPENFADARIDLIWNIDVFNFIRREYVWLDMDVVHGALQMPVDPGEIPENFEQRISAILDKPRNFG